MVGLWWGSFGGCGSARGFAQNAGALIKFEFAKETVSILVDLSALSDELMHLMWNFWGFEKARAIIV